MCSTGRWYVVGGEWVEPDCNLPSGEAVCRQLLYSQRYFKKTFGAPAIHRLQRRFLWSRRFAAAAADKGRPPRVRNDAAAAT